MASSVKVKFVASDPNRGGLPVKRKQVQHACDACRKKKRRCIHAEDSAETSVPEVGAEEQSESRETASVYQASPAPEPTPSVMNGTSAATAMGYGGNPAQRRASAYSQQRTPQDASLSSPSESSKPQTRFVGDLNPEAMFVEAMGPPAKHENPQKYDVGIWLSLNNGNGSSGSGSQFITSRPPQAMDRFLLPFVKEHCMTTMPPQGDFEKLKAVFYQKIHPIFPVIPPSSITSDSPDPTEIVLKQLICLAASTDPNSAQYLRLQNHGTGLLSPQEFSQTISSAVRATLETSLIPDRVLHIRALTILSMYTQPTCPEEADLPAQLGGRAIHHVQTLGLQLLGFDAPNCDELESLFCAVWALDRLNAAQYGRPCVMHERDIGTNLTNCIRKQQPCFRLLLSVIQWLDHVIDLYRPGPTAEASGAQKVAFMDLPVLEAMIVDADALRVPSFLIATIETLYHAVIILSCRLHRPGTLPAASTLPPPSSNARRSLAADRIACAIPRDHLSPMPFVPYAMSLALSVEYRKMRHSRLPMFRARAMNAFRRNCEMLRNFGDYFWSARVVANLGERVMKEMERAATTLTKEATPPAESSTAPQQANSSIIPSQNVFPLADLTGIDTATGLDNLVDFSMVDAVSGQDLFGHIDPNFNLNAVEDALEANLDIGLPLNWGEWGHFATS